MAHSHPSRLLLLAALAVPLLHAGDALAGMEIGPLVQASLMDSLEAKLNNETGAFPCTVVPHGLAVRLAPGWKAIMAYDSATACPMGGWTAATLKLRGVAFNVETRGPSTTIAGDALFRCAAGPGWASPAGALADPRPDSVAPNPRPGPLPRDWLRWRGVHLHGEQVVLAYDVGTCAVLESPGLAGAGEGLVRTLHCAAGPRLSAVLADATTASIDGLAAVAAAVAVRVVGAPTGAALRVADGRLLLDLPERSQPAACRVLYATAADAAARLAGALPPANDLPALIKGGPGRFAQEITVAGALGSGDGAWVVDTIPLPTGNPWKAVLRLGGLDFFADGRAAVCSVEGDVWTVSGLDRDLKQVRWKRFATGLHAPLGLRIVKDVIHVACRDQIARLIDRDGDGEADQHECVSNAFEITNSFQSFTFDLQSDAAGNLYTALAAPVRAGGRGFHRLTAHHGCVLKVAPDGSRCDVVASGLRAPNGIGVGPDGIVTSGDNEGTWVPRCPLHVLPPGGFAGVVDTAHRPDATSLPMPKPLLWFPKHLDNSNGGQCWAPAGDRWGPYGGFLLHTSYGTCSLIAIMRQSVGGMQQGAAVRLPLSFASGIMRPRFNPADGHLWVCGLKGWQSSAAKEGCLQRVRATGKPACLPVAWKARGSGIDLTFSDALAPAAARPENCTIEAWNIAWTSGYGSPESALPGKPGSAGAKGQNRSTLTVSAAALSADGRTLSLTVPDLAPAHCLRLAYKLDFAARAGVSGEVCATIHALE